MEERQEYRWLLNDARQIESIEPYDKLLSQKLVEECMVAANRCAASFLAQHKASGPFVVHPGFRANRENELRKFLQLHAPALADEDPFTLEGYRRIMRGLSSGEQGLPLRAMVNRLMTRAELSCEPAEHMGMSLPAYTNCTSPLRKYIDFLVHLQIKSLLHGGLAQEVDSEMLEALAARLADRRAATLEADRWLASRYLDRLVADQNPAFRARISHINSSGCNLRLVDNGLEGFVDLRPDAEKFSYDKWTASLTSTTRRFQLQDEVQVHYLGPDRENQWQARFAMTPESGLKTLRAASSAERAPEAASGTPSHTSTQHGDATPLAADKDTSLQG